MVIYCINLPTLDAKNHREHFVVVQIMDVLPGAEPKCESSDTRYLYTTRGCTVWRSVVTHFVLKHCHKLLSLIRTKVTFAKQHSVMFRLVGRVDCTLAQYLIYFISLSLSINW